jgi:hypothetical protein
MVIDMRVFISILCSIYERSSRECATAAQISFGAGDPFHVLTAFGGGSNMTDIGD